MGVVDLRPPRVKLDGGSVRTYDEGHSVEINPPVARGGALLVHKERIPEILEDAMRCTKCRGGDVVVQVGWPGEDGFPIQLCRTCVDRPVGNPLVIKFRE